MFHAEMHLLLRGVVLMTACVLESSTSLDLVASAVLLCSDRVTSIDIIF